VLLGCCVDGLEEPGLDGCDCGMLCAMAKPLPNTTIIASL